MKEMNLKKWLKTIVATILVLPVLVGCVNPSDSSSDDDGSDPDFEVKYIEEKIEIYNKLLGEWKAVNPDHFNVEWRNNCVIHFEPKEIWVDSDGKHNTCKTFEKPFYNYILLPAEYDDSEEYNNLYDFEKTLASEDINKTIFLDMAIIAGPHGDNKLLAIDRLDEGVITFNKGYSDLEKIGFNKKDPGKEPGGEPGNNVDLDVDGTYSFEVAGQANAASTVVLKNGTITVKNKKTSNERSGEYEIDGNTITITYSSYDAEEFTINKVDDSTIKLVYAGSEETSFVCMMLFQDIYNNTLTLVKE